MRRFWPCLRRRHRVDLWRGRRRILIACGVRRVRDDLANLLDDVRGKEDGTNVEYEENHTSYRHLPTNQAAEESRPQPIQRTSTSLSAFDRNQHIHYSTLTDGGLRGFHDFIKLVLALNVAAGVAIVALEAYRCLLVE
eukprot:scaffold69_cov198-Alexandrium_tamarense.AAC.101